MNGRWFSMGWYVMTARYKLIHLRLHRYAVWEWLRQLRLEILVKLAFDRKAGNDNCNDIIF